MNKIKIYFALILISLSVLFAQNDEGIENRYEKNEYRIKMRDGVRLYTAVFSPKDTTENHPIIIWRTPYSCAPYGKNKFSRYAKIYKHFTNENYIIVLQDVRGRFMSEGKFVDMRPFIPDKKDSTDIDEASDTYDTVEWLINNIPHNNGRVGVWGISYPGFYAAMAAMSGHPAIKAVSPQAPISDWFIGDDMHHNGAFSLMMAFNFFKVFGLPRDSLTTKWPRPVQYPSPDAYTFFLNMGPVKNANKLYLKNKIEFWNQATANGIYNEFWQAKSTLQHFYNVKPAVMTVGGWFDGEDLFGALHTYEEIEKKNPGIFNILVMGPWPHGAWGRGNVSSFGEMEFGQNTSEFYRKNVELPFFNYFLKDKGKLNLPEALIFETGNNKWHKFDKWPPENVTERTLFFDDNSGLEFTLPAENRIDFDEFISDPMHPVPYTSAVLDSRKFYNRTYVVEDQRFASTRTDVLSYETDTLESDITIAGPIYADLYVSTSGTDADWIVKVIDVFPEYEKDKKKNNKTVEMGNYQMLIRAEIMRGKFRNSFENPEPFEPGKITKVSFVLPDVMHTFKKGHKIMVQVQSSWFPLFDRNPQTFTDIYNADERDFRKAVHRVYHTEKYPSSVTFNFYEKQD